MKKFLLLLLVTLTFSCFLFSQSLCIVSQGPESSSQYLTVREKIEIINKKDSILKGFYSNDTLAYVYKLYKNKPSGLYKVFHPNGQLKYRSVFINGKLDGYWKEYNPDGKLIISGKYRAGRKDGSWIFFKVDKVEVYKDGVADGRWRIGEGWTPRSLYKYKNGVLLGSKRHRPKKNVFK